MNEILSYLQQQYRPLSIILYGSYADGTNHENSDFDALVISPASTETHDAACVAGVPLDVFVYPAAHFDGDFDPEDFVQLADGKILLDTDGLGARVQEKARQYVASLPVKSLEEAREGAQWCQKMLRRTERQDVEGLFRWHWVLIDSLEIFCDLVQHRYAGPKKTLRWMETAYPDAYALYRDALTRFQHDTLTAWIEYLSRL